MWHRRMWLRYLQHTSLGQLQCWQLRQNAQSVQRRSTYVKPKPQNTEQRAASLSRRAPSPSHLTPSHSTVPSPPSCGQDRSLAVLHWPGLTLTLTQLCNFDVWRSVSFFKTPYAVVFCFFFSRAGILFFTFNKSIFHHPATPSRLRIFVKKQKKLHQPDSSVDPLPVPRLKLTNLGLESKRQLL